jgi:RsiG-like
MDDLLCPLDPPLVGTSSPSAETILVLSQSAQSRLVISAGRDTMAGMTYPGGQRRIDRVLAEGFLDRLQEVSLEELRTMRHEAEQEETDLSYIRRLLQGRLDIMRAEQKRRAGGPDAPSLIDLLPGILADEAGPAAPHGLGRHATVEPSRADMHRRHVEALVADVDLSDPFSHSDESLAHVIEVLEHEESEVSANRRALQHVMDNCQDEISRRYRDGDATVDELLPSESN